MTIKLGKECEICGHKQTANVLKTPIFWRISTNKTVLKHGDYFHNRKGNCTAKEPMGSV
jgi:hypothetical protein